MEKLKRSTVQIFSYLCKALLELNYIFSSPVLFILTTKLLLIVSCAFAFIFTFLNSNAAMRSVNLSLIFSTITDCARVFIILSTADMPVYQVLI